MDRCTTRGGAGREALSEETNGRAKFDLRTVIVTAAIVVGQGLVQWGIFSTTLAEHTRHLELQDKQIELMQKRMDERSVAREEYERRHVELQERVREQEIRLRDIERKVR